ncbi:putative 25S rRNA (uracil(2634)-N(3))-methyltransferase [Microsporum audouinii]
MGKARKPAVKQSSKKMKSFPKLSTSMKKAQNAKQQQQKQNQPRIPFRPSDRILLIGEGDFSFALSLATHHKCRRRLMATCYDSEEKLLEKYPDAKGHIEQLEAFSSPSTGSKGALKRKRGDNDDSESPEEGDKETQNHLKADSAHTSKSSVSSPKVVFSIDARKLGSSGGGGKLIRSGFPVPSRKRNYSNRANNGSHETEGGGPWDIICFNFPHVGGLSTDVNRQVRSNQELLVGFFKACVPLLSVPASSDDWSDFEDEDEYPDEEEDDSLFNPDEVRYKPRKEPGYVIVTLFEGEPYTLWNIRDLARHAGLRVVTSFSFPWTSYPGYSHARTIGAIEGKDGGRGGWKGEEREARSYVFERKGFEDQNINSGKRKRTAGGSESGSD